VNQHHNLLIAFNLCFAVSIQSIRKPLIPDAEVSVSASVPVLSTLSAIAEPL
jgi:hypothetical protein